MGTGQALRAVLPQLSAECIGKLSLRIEGEESGGREVLRGACSIGDETKLRLTYLDSLVVDPVLDKSPLLIELLAFAQGR